MNKEIKLSNAILRDTLKQILISSVALDAFCIDYFPDVFRRFSNAMDTEQKFNILILEIAQQKIIDAIKQKFNQEVLYGAIQSSMDEAKRREDPTPIDRIKWCALRNKLTSILFVLLAIILVSGDPATGRSQIVPRVKALFITDPIRVLEQAWADLENHDYSQSIEKARCVMLMRSSSEQQKRQASLIISYITEAKAKEVVARELSLILKDNSTPNLTGYIREIAAQNNIALPETSKNSMAVKDQQISQSPDAESEKTKTDLGDVRAQVAKSDEQLAKVISERDQLRWQISNFQSTLERMSTTFQSSLSAIERSMFNLPNSFSSTDSQGAIMQSAVYSLKMELGSAKNQLESASRDCEQLKMQTAVMQGQLYVPRGPVKKVKARFRSRPKTIAKDEEE